MFEGIAKTNTTNTFDEQYIDNDLFEGIAKTNTTNTKSLIRSATRLFEGIAKTNTTNTTFSQIKIDCSLRVLLKQIQHTLN